MRDRREYVLTVYVGAGTSWMNHRISPVREAIRKRGVIADSYPSEETATGVKLHEFHVLATMSEMVGIRIQLKTVLGETTELRELGKAPRLRWWRLRETRFHWWPRFDRQPNGTLDVSLWWWTWYNEPETEEERAWSNGGS
jgi:hypothetical protein